MVGGIIRFTYTEVVNAVFLRMKNRIQIVIFFGDY